MKISRPFTTITVLNLDNVKLRLFTRHNPEETIPMTFMQSIGQLSSIYKTMNIDKINEMTEYCLANISGISRIEFINPKTENTICVDL